MTPRQVVEEWVLAPTLARRTVTRYIVTRYRWRRPMAAPAERSATRIGQRIGRLGNQDMARLGIALAFVLGLAD